MISRSPGAAEGFGRLPAPATMRVAPGSTPAGMVMRERALADDEPASATRRARIVDDLARRRDTASRRARPRWGGCPAGSGRGRGRCTRGTPRACSRAPSHRPWQSRSHDRLYVELLLAAEGRLLEGDLEVLRGVAALAAAHAEDAEHVAEDAVDGDVADVDDAAGEGPVRAEGRARVLGAVAEAVVHGAAVRIGEHLVRRC